ncbi:MAG: hypothetical protein IKI71_00255 [Lachnospiraceae bacterium]|nr:hypothetical protein [Lachnospiraceae bacterium]
MLRKLAKKPVGASTASPEEESESTEETESTVGDDILASLFMPCNLAL